MILLDYSQIVVASWMVSQNPLVQQKSNNIQADSKGFLRHFILNSIRAHNKRFSKKYGKMVICCDSIGPSWRHEYFEYYKKNRKKNEELWAEIFKNGYEILDEIEQNFPYKVIRVSRAEGDDVISVLTRNPGNHIIVSGDRDFVQLQVNNNIQQYDQVRNKYVKTDSPADANEKLKISIIKGCTGDGIPNIKSDDDCYVKSDKRAKPIRQKWLDKCLSQEPEQFCEDNLMLSRYERNRTLIDLNNVPDDIVKLIEEQYNKPYIVSNNGKILPYLMKTKCVRLIKDVEDF